MLSIGEVSMLPAGSGSNARQIRLERSAHEFEAQLMKELLEPMTRGGGLLGEEEDKEGGVLGQFAAEALARGISNQGGFGIASRIMKEFPHSGQVQVTEK